MLKSKYNSLAQQGFTLIELLVVVLIIGILATVAVPQYQKAVIKSRFAQLQVVGNSLVRSQEDFYLNNGEWNTTNFRLFSLLPEGTLNSSNTRFTVDDVECRYNGESSREILCEDNGNSHVPLWIYAYYGTSSTSLHGVYCVATNEEKKRMCLSIGATHTRTIGNYYWYRITKL